MKDISSGKYEFMKNCNKLGRDVNECAYFKRLSPGSYFVHQGPMKSIYVILWNSNNNTRANIPSVHPERTSLQKVFERILRLKTVQLWLVAYLEWLYVSVASGKCSTSNVTILNTKESCAFSAVPLTSNCKRSSMGGLLPGRIIPLIAESRYNFIEK